MAVDDDIAELDAKLGTGETTTAPTTQTAPATQAAPDPIEDTITKLDQKLGTTSDPRTGKDKVSQPEPELPWYDRPGKWASKVPMVDEYGNVIQGSEGTLSAMTPRQMAELGLLGASLPLDGVALGAAGAIKGAMTARKLIQATNNARYYMNVPTTAAKVLAGTTRAGIDAAQGAASAAVSGDGNPTDIATGAVLGPTARWLTASGVPSALSYLANNPKAQAVVDSLLKVGGGVGGLVGGALGGHDFGHVVQGLLTGGGLLGGGMLGASVTPIMHGLEPLITPVGNLLYRAARAGAPAIPYAVGQGAGQMALPSP